MAPETMTTVITDKLRTTRRLLSIVDSLTPNDNMAVRTKRNVKDKKSGYLAMKGTLIGSVSIRADLIVKLKREST